MKRLIAAALCTSLGCGTAATITRKNRTDEGRIVRSTSTSVIIDNGAGERSIPREEITDIDHPGNAVAVVGAVLLGYGILNIAVAASHCEEKGGAFCTGVFIPAAAGLGMSIWGLTVWSRSTRAVREPGPRGPELSLAPLVVRSGQSAGGGGSLTLRY
jgi:RNase P/RNase MRP subunit p29